ncbi:MAG: ComEC/Rec2 family competence protein [Clostridia bacterium]|nr:ComEC/Rec2 family competence protein [Clostridia bacterium]
MSDNAYGRTTLGIRTISIDEEDASYAMLATVDSSMMGAIKCGDTVILHGEIIDFADSDNSFDRRSYCYSRGYGAEVASVTELALLTPVDRERVDLLANMRKYITETLLRETDPATGGFLAALIIGDKTHLEPNINLNYTRLGISHILALSGMHLVIITSILRAILKRMRIGKKVVLILTTVFCFFYMALSGFSPSVIRATIMLTVTNGMFLLTGSHDSYTSLPLSVILILLFEPYAVYDLSLWLSVFATLGVIFYGDLAKKKTERGREHKKSGLLNAIRDSIVESMFASLFSIAATYFIVLGKFPTQSALAPVATLVLSFPINLLIPTGFALVLLHPILPFGGAVSFVCEVINYATEMLSRLDWSVYTVDNIPVKIIVVLFSITFFAFVVLKVKRKRAMLIILSVLYISISAVGITMTQTQRYTDSFEYRSTSGSDTMLIRESGRFTVIYNGNQTSSSAYNDADTIIESGIVSIDNLVITTYRSGTVGFIERFAGKIKVGTIYIPKPVSTADLAIAESVASRLSFFGTELSFYELEMPLIFGSYRFHLLARTPYHTGVSPDCIYTLKYNKEYYTYISRGAEKSFESLARLIGYSSDHLFFGSKGSHLSDNSGFNILSDNIKDITYSGYLPLSESSRTYYEEKEVPIRKIDTSLNIIVKR